MLLIFNLRLLVDCSTKVSILNLIEDCLPFLTHMISEKLRTAKNLETLAEVLSDLSEDLQKKLTKNKFDPSLRIITPDRLQLILLNPSKCYRAFNIPKKSGGSRLIESPSRELKVIQWSLLEKLDKSYVPPEVVHGFVKGRSIKTNAQPHVDRDFVLNMDIRHFFHSIQSTRVENFLKERLSFTDFAAKNIAKLVSLRGVLPMGAPTSPLLSNMVFQRADRRLSGLAVKSGVSYTRYADDLSFSSDSKNAILEILNVAPRILKDENFEVLISKTRILHTGQSQRVTGVVVNEKLNAPRSFRKTTRAMRHSIKIQRRLCENEEKASVMAAMYHEEKNSLSVMKPGSFMRILHGRIAFEKMIMES